MGLFNKNSKKCDLCGGDYNILTGSAVKDGTICLNCVKKFSSLVLFTKKNTLQEIQEHLEYRENNDKLFDTFKETDSVEKFISADRNLKKFCMPFLYAFGRKPDLFDFNQLVDYELNEDGESITSRKVSLGKAAVGTVIAGPVGTIIGGLSGKSKTNGVTKSMVIRISVNSPLTTQIEIPIIKSETKKSSFTYKIAKEQANKIISLLDVISNIAEADIQVAQPVNNSNDNSISDELIKLKSLVESGVISQDDFEKAKNKLLGI